MTTWPRSRNRPRPRCTSGCRRVHANRWPATDADPTALPRRVRLRRRGLARRRDPPALPAALRRLRQPVGLRDLPSQPRRLPGLIPAHRNHRRNRRRRTRKRKQLWLGRFRWSPVCGRRRLRPPRLRPHRLDLTTPDELTAMPTGSTQVLEDGQDAPVVSWGVFEIEALKDAADVCLERFDAEAQPVGDGLIGLARRHQGEYFTFPWCQIVQGALGGGVGASAGGQCPGRRRTLRPSPVRGRRIGCRRRGRGL